MNRECYAEEGSCVSKCDGSINELLRFQLRCNWYFDGGIVFVKLLEDGGGHTSS